MTSEPLWDKVHGSVASLARDEAITGAIVISHGVKFDYGENMNYVPVSSATSWLVAEGPLAWRVRLRGNF